MVVGKVSELEPEVAKLSEAQGRERMFQIRTAGAKTLRGD